MESELKGKVIGQDEAVDDQQGAPPFTRRSQRPSPADWLLCLPWTNGRGKTFLARTLAEFMFGDADALIQIDMSEYMEKFTASRLIGSPPGYVGYEEGDNCPKPFEGARIRSCSSTRSRRRIPT